MPLGPPEEEIDDPDVPLDPGIEIPGTPVEEIHDPEVPLADAPKTGDTNNILLMLVLLAVGAGGLLVVRKKS